MGLIAEEEDDLFVAAGLVSSIKVQIPSTADPPCYHSIPVSEIMVMVYDEAANATKTRTLPVVSNMPLDGTAKNQDDIQDDDDDDEEEEVQDWDMTTTTTTTITTNRRPSLKRLHQVVAARLGTSLPPQQPQSDNGNNDDYLKLFYQDSDGDLVALTNDDDLYRALVMMMKTPSDDNHAKEYGRSVKIVPMFPTTPMAAITTQTATSTLSSDSQSKADKTVDKMKKKKKSKETSSSTTTRKKKSGKEAKQPKKMNETVKNEPVPESEISDKTKIVVVVEEEDEELAASTAATTTEAPVAISATLSPGSEQPEAVKQSDDTSTTSTTTTTTPFMIKLCLTGKEPKCRLISLSRILNNDNDNSDLPSLHKLWALAMELAAGQGSRQEDGANRIVTKKQQQQQQDFALVCNNPKTGQSMILKTNQQLDLAMDQCSTTSLTTTVLKVHVQPCIHQRIHLVCDERKISNVSGNMLVDHLTNEISYSKLVDLARFSFRWDDQVPIELRYHRDSTLFTQWPWLLRLGRKGSILRNTLDLQNIINFRSPNNNNNNSRSNVPADMPVTIVCRKLDNNTLKLQLAAPFKGLFEKGRPWLLVALVVGVVAMVLPVLVNYLPTVHGGGAGWSNTYLQTTPIPEPSPVCECNCDCPAVPTEIPKVNKLTTKEDSVPCTCTEPAKQRSTEETMEISKELILSPIKAIVRGKHSQVRLHPQPLVLFFHMSNRAFWKLPSTGIPGRYRAKARVSRRGPNSTFLYAGVMTLNNNDKDEWDGNELPIREAWYYREQLAPVEIEPTGSWNQFRLEMLGVFDLFTTPQRNQVFVVVANGHKKSPGVDFQEIFLTLIDDNDDEE
ncbi:hypothetical protein ACA910_014143 [Epithemia clementina (nom. ined.)]